MLGLANWGTFYLLAVIFTLAHSLLRVDIGRRPFRLRVIVEPLIGRNHTFGAEIIAASWLASWAAREITGDQSPLSIYAGIDAATIIAFSVPMLRKKAVWAAVCVILHAVMLFLHLAHFVTDESNFWLYVRVLNGLFLASLIAINVATAAGRHAWGERLDSVCMATFPGWSWSGIRIPRRAGYPG